MTDRDPQSAAAVTRRTRLANSAAAACALAPRGGAAAAQASAPALPRGAAAKVSSLADARQAVHDTADRTIITAVIEIS